MQAVCKRTMPVNESNSKEWERFVSSCRSLLNGIGRMDGMKKGRLTLFYEHLSAMNGLPVLERNLLEEEPFRISPNFIKNAENADSTQLFNDLILGFSP